MVVNDGRQQSNTWLGSRVISTQKIRHASYDAFVSRVYEAS